MAETSDQLPLEGEHNSALPPSSWVPGLRYTADWIAPEAQEALLTNIDGEAWSTQLRRRVQHYGHRYDYGRRGVATAAEAAVPPLPVWARRLATRLVSEGLMDREADQVIVNEYQPGQGISAHVDSVPHFGPVVASLSLGWAASWTSPTRRTARSWRCLSRRAACSSWPARPGSPGAMPSPRARATPAPRVVSHAPDASP